MSQIDDIPIPIAWTIAGSDSGGGAGIQADLKTMNAFGVHGCSAITALTAQNTQGVLRSEPVSEAMMNAQLEALAVDLPPAAIKTGMLGSKAICRILAEFFATFPAPGVQTPKPLLVCDPILKSTSGADLLDPEALDLLVHELLPWVDVLTPNLPEAETLLGKIPGSIEAAAELLLENGVASVLIKGGHAPGSECRDYWTDGRQAFWLCSPRIDSRATHGTGCILSAAITAGLALGNAIPEAIMDAKTFLNQCLRSPAHLGGGHGPMHINRFENRPVDRPALQ